MHDAKARKLAILPVVFLMAWPIGANAWTERAVAVRDLHGTLTLPERAGSGPGVLILAGSGPVDRDGNFPGGSNDSLKLLAHGLADRGIASLRFDKRGVAASAAGMREEDLRFSSYVDDAIVWLRILQSEPSVSKSIILGHSEGALVATLAAQKSKVAGLILAAGAGEPAPTIIARQLAAAGVPASLQELSKGIADSLSAGKPVSDVPPELLQLYRPSVQNYLMSWFPIDPAKELAKIECPVLIVHGTTDLQVSVADAQRLLASRPNSQLVLVDGMNHVLKQASLDRVANFQTYADPTLPVNPVLLSTIAEFIGGL